VLRGSSIFVYFWQFRLFWILPDHTLGISFILVGHTNLWVRYLFIGLFDLGVSKILTDDTLNYNILAPVDYGSGYLAI